MFIGEFYIRLGKDKLNLHCISSSYVNKHYQYLHVYNVYTQVKIRVFTDLHLTVERKVEDYSGM